MGELNFTNKMKIFQLCEQIKNAIDWSFDSHNHYQDMCQQICDSANEIEDELKNE